MTNKKVVFVLGAPGAGKGTQCTKITQQLPFAHISAGELLRTERQIPNSQHGELIQACINEGKIVPAEITCKLLQREMHSSPHDNFLIDGFPRNQENRDGWDKTLGDSCEILFVLLLDCPVDVCIERCMKRGDLDRVRRVDDNLEVLEKRIKTYVVETQPTVRYYDDMKLLRRIDGSRTEEEVFEDVQKLFENY